MHVKQREYFRIPLTVFSSLRLRKLGGKMLSVGEEFEVQIQNISGGGLCFQSDRDLPLSEVLAWQFQIDMGNEGINVLGQLVWKRSIEGGMFLYGVKFLFLDETEQKNLISRLHTLLIRQRQSEKSLLK